MILYRPRFLHLKTNSHDEIPGNVFATQRNVRHSALHPRVNPYAVVILCVQRQTQESAIIIECDKSSIEQMIDTRGEQQPILSIQSLLVRAAISTRFTMACYEVFNPVDLGDPTT